MAPAPSCFWVKPMSRVTASAGGHPPIGGTFASMMTFLHFATSAYGVAIARKARGLAHAEIAASAGDVLDVELFAEFLRQFLRHQPCDDVGGASGRERHDDLDRLAGVLLGKSADN